jgi:ankyrin repeat protein
LIPVVFFSIVILFNFLGKAAESEECQYAYFSSLPLEIMSQYIFKHFDFRTWRETLILVCTQWQLAAQASTLPKQLVVFCNKPKQLSSVLATYNVTTLVLEAPIKKMSHLSQILCASPKLSTVVFKTVCAIDGVTYNEWIPRGPAGSAVALWAANTFDHITTLSIGSEVGLLTLFPNVTQVKLETIRPQYQMERITDKVAYPNVRELEVIKLDAQSLERITVVFPGLKTVYLNALESPSAVEQLERVGERLGIQISWSEISPNFTTLSYVDYFNSFGRTPLQHFLASGNAEKVKDVLLKYTNHVYEQDLLGREPQFKFPTRSSEFISTASEVRKSTLPVPMLKTLVKHGGLNYWTALPVNAECLVPEAKNFMPVPPEALRTIVKLNCQRSFPVNRIAEAVGEEVFNALAKTRDHKGNTLLHLLARKNVDLPMYWDRLLEYSDVKALNDKQENAATIAFRAKYWSCWRMLVEQGAPIQYDKYNMASTKNFLSWILFNGIPLTVLSNFTDARYLQSMFYALQSLDSPLRPSVFRELIQLGVDPKQRNQRGQSLLNVLVEERNNGLMVMWDCIAEQNLDLDEYDDSGRTPLITAIELGLIKIVSFLLEKGANPNAHGLLSWGKKIYPVQLAQTVIDEAVIGLLASYGADFTLEDEDGNTILNAAIVNYKHTAVHALSVFIPINKPNCHNQTPLSHSIEMASLPRIGACLASGADVNQLAGPLMQPPLLMALSLDQDDLSIVRYLLATGRVNVTLKDKAGRSFVNYVLRTESAIEQSKLKSKMNIDDLQTVRY